METFISIVHIIVALFLILLVLIQDSKGGGLGMMSGGNSNSVLGTAGAENIIAKMTRWTAVVFAGTCIGLTIWNAKSTRSVLGDAPIIQKVEEKKLPEAKTETESTKSQESTGK